MAGRYYRGRGAGCGGEVANIFSEPSVIAQLRCNRPIVVVAVVTVAAAVKR